MFSKAIVRPPGANYAEGLTQSRLGLPDHVRALHQHSLYCAALEKCGLTLVRLQVDERYPDSTFVEDTAVIIGTLPDDATSAGRKRRVRATAPRALAPTAILSRPGAASRMGEVENIKEVLGQLGFEIHSIAEPATLDGGDICEVENHFFIGISERTNKVGAMQLAELLTSYGCTSSFVDIRDVKSILHLKSGLAYLGDNRLVVIDVLAHHEEFDGYELVRIGSDEEYAANCVRVNDYILVAAGYPEFEGTLQDLGYKTLSVEMTEFQKMDGGLSCLSLRF
jgi:dimethylargininase